LAATWNQDWRRIQGTACREARAAHYIQRKSRREFHGRKDHQNKKQAFTQGPAYTYSKVKTRSHQGRRSLSTASPVIWVSQMDKTHLVVEFESKGSSNRPLAGFQEVLAKRQAPEY